MKRIYLFCSAGMSTSMLASNMQEVADKHKLPFEVQAFPDGKIGEIIAEQHRDVILLGPNLGTMTFQVNMQIPEFRLQ